MKCVPHEAGTARLVCFLVDSHPSYVKCGPEGQICLYNLSNNNREDVLTFMQAYFKSLQTKENSREHKE